MRCSRGAWWSSLRTRITLTVTVVSLLVSGVVCTVLAQRSADAATESLRTQALGRVAVVADGYALDGRLRSGATKDQVNLPSRLGELVADRDRRVRVSYYDGARMWASERLDRDVVLTVSLDASSLRAQDEQRIAALAWAAAAAVVLSGLLGWAAGTALSRRLRVAADAARRIADGEQGVRAAQGGSDEVAVLTRTIDEMVDALQHRISAEQDFTADVAHELRTPLTGLVSAAELLPDDDVGRLVRAQVDRLRRLAADLLEVSRLDRGTEDVQLVEASLADAVSSSVMALFTDDVDVRVRVLSTAGVLIDQRRFDRVLGNLLVNLARHGGGRGELTVDGRTVTLTDEGRGYPDDVIEHGPRRFHGQGATKGSGLGLTIMQKQAAAMGATVVYGRAPGGGALTSITFASSDDADAD